MTNHSNIDARLGMLERHDPVAAACIRTALNTATPAAPQHHEADGRDPEARVRAWLDTNLAEPGIVIVPGAGSSETVPLLLNAMPGHSTALLIETSSAHAATLFTTCPLEDYVASGRVRLAFDRDGARIEEQFLDLLDIRHGPALLVFDLVSWQEDEADFYKTTLLRLRDRMRTKVFNLGTLMKMGPLWQVNTFKNLPVLIRNPGISELGGMFSGRPAVVVAAGPSLNDALPFLAKAAPNLVMIAVGQALRPLRAAGITPDLVMSVDAKEMTRHQFETRCEDLYLACSSIVFPDLPPRFRGIFSGHINANPVGAWISSFGKSKGNLFPGGTVTSTAMDLAVQMGCNPVITVGLDLCMGNDGSSHARNTQYDGERICKEHLIAVQGNHDETVFTKGDFRVYIDLIGDYVRFHTETEFINANNGGARIDGMRVVPHEYLTGVACEPCNAYERIRDCHTSFVPGNIEAVYADIEEIIAQMETLENDAVRAAMLCNRLMMIMRMPYNGGSTDARECLDELQAIDAGIARARKSCLLLEMSLRQAYYSVGKKAEEHEQGLSPAVLANRESRKLYEQIGGAAKWTRDLLADLLRDFASLPEYRADAEPEKRLHAIRGGISVPTANAAHGRARLTA